MLESLHHPGVVKVLERGDSTGTPFLAMELATTSMSCLGDAKDALPNVLRSSPALMLDLFRQACEGVAYMHSQSILHRDIKPSNILMMLNSCQMRAVMGDFGVSSVASLQGELTDTQEVIGSRRFRAPECESNTKHSRKSDVYSLGKTLEFMISCIQPVAPAGTLDESAYHFDTETYHRLSATVSRATNPSHAKRHASVTEFLDDLPQVAIASDRSATRQQPKSRNLLTNDEYNVLAAAIALCPRRSDRAAVYDLQAHTYCDGLSPIGLSLSLRKLEGIKFIESFDVETESGETDERYSPSSEGADWLRQNRLGYRPSIRSTKTKYGGNLLDEEP